MSRVLFCTVRMQRGYGVDRVVHEVSERLVKLGHEVAVVCTTMDGHLDGSYELIQMQVAKTEGLLRIADEFAADVVVAHSSPFIELLPIVRHRYPSWVWEHGDPTPELFGEDSEERAAIKSYKAEFCYPVVDGVLAVSEFVRADMRWPAAEVIYNGCDHAPDSGSKGLQDRRLSRRQPLRLGALMRLGRHEERYKGNGLFVRLLRELAATDLPVEASVMGRGTDLDAAELREAGCRVHLNANDEEKWEYLRHLDVFVSCSLWEGFNLPLVEAQAVGTLAVAFDCGAHPETCPLTFPNLAEMVGFIGRIANDPELLSGHARAGYRHARGSFRWSEASSRFETLVLSAATSGGRAERRRRPRQSRAVPMGLFLRLVQWRQNLAATIRSLRLYGVRITLKKARRRLREAFQARGG